jgi:type I restriction enzyme M protein
VPNIGEIINKALHDIEENNKEKLDGVYSEILTSTPLHALGETKETEIRALKV